MHGNDVQVAEDEQKGPKGVGRKDCNEGGWRDGVGESQALLGEQKHHGGEQEVEGESSPPSPREPSADLSSPCH